MKNFINTILLVLIGLSLQAQSYSLDASFQPFFDIRNPFDIGDPRDLWENPSNGKVYIVGSFYTVVNSQAHASITSMNRDGSRNTIFQGFSTRNNWGRIIYLNDSVFVLSQNGNQLMINPSGASTNNHWRTNYRLTVSCSVTNLPYFFSDGSSLMGNTTDRTGNPCSIYNPPDTFPGRHLIKVNPQGLWDSTFAYDASYGPEEFYPIDSNRILVYGDYRYFTHYDGVRVNGLCRIFTDGSLDTSFQYVMTDSIYNGKVFKVRNVQSDGSFFLLGDFDVAGRANQSYKIARFNPDGSFDPGFNTSPPVHTFAGFPPGLLGLGDVCSTEDGGYLVGGMFNRYQGYTKHNIAKLDSAGNVEPQYFTGLGPDSASSPPLSGADSLAGVNRIVKSKFGGYYVMGDFFTWNGAPVQGIVRINGLVTDIAENQVPSPSFSLYPNPIESELRISSNQAMQNLEVYNLLGQNLQSQSLGNNHHSRLDLSALKAGIYLLKVQINGRWYSRKVVKKS